MARRGHADGSRLIGWDRVRQQARAHAAAPAPHYALAIDNPEFYAHQRHTVCLCARHRQRHTPHALCPALPPWMTRRLPGD